MALPRLFRDPFGRLPPGYRFHLEEWLATPSGRHLVAAEARVLDDITPCIFGYHAVQVASLGAGDLLGGSRILNRVLVGTTADAAGCGLLASPRQLPFADESVDLVVLHHSLDFEDGPYQVLREASRVVIPGGALVIVGFNPWSLFGLMRLLRWGVPVAPWFARSISPYRVTDWLRLLDFRAEGLESGYYAAPGAGEPAPDGFVERLGTRWWPQLGTFYVLVARRSVAPLTPVFRPERLRRSVPVGIPATTRITRR
jgi:SAM-dependent methyltransferase